MKKLDNIIIAVIITMATYYVSPILLIGMLFIAIRGCIESKSISFIKDWAHLMLGTVMAWARMIGRIAKTGLILDALQNFYKEIESI